MTQNKQKQYLQKIYGDAGIAEYLQKIKKFPILSPEREVTLARKWKYEKDIEAVQILVSSHLRLVASIAKKYQGYNFAFAEIISEGNIGLMKAVRKFDPDKGFRLATYAVWWIRASIQEYILASWSLVKMSGSASNKKIFFNLGKIKNKIAQYDRQQTETQKLQQVADKLGVKNKDVVEMGQRIKGDRSLNVKVSDNDGATQWQDWLEDDKPNQEITLLENQQNKIRKQIFQEALQKLEKRERDIFIARRLQEPVQTLEVLSQKYSVSRERVRQIEMKTFEKLQKTVQKDIHKMQFHKKPNLIEHNV